MLDAVITAVGARRVFITTGDTNAAMKALLTRGGWTAAGCVAGVNTDETAECFYYRDLPRL